MSTPDPSGRARRRRLAATALLLLAACGERPAPYSGASYTHVDSQGGGDLTIDGVAVELDGSVHFVYELRSSTADGTQKSMTVNDLPFGLREGEFFIGGRTYGPADPGQTVRITAEGVTVDGEARGPLPR